MSPVPEKVLTTALLAAGCFASAFDTFAVEPKLPELTPHTDVDTNAKHSRYKINGHSLIVIPTEGEAEINKEAVAVELQKRYESLLEYLQNEIEVNYYYLPVRQLKEKSLATLREECAGLSEKLASELSGEARNKTEAEFKKALERRENNAIYKGYTPPGFIPVRSLYCPETQAFWTEMICPYNSKVVKLVSKNEDVLSTRTYIRNKLRITKNENLSDGTSEVDEYASQGYVHARKNYSVINGEVKLANLITFNADSSKMFEASLVNNVLTYCDSQGEPLAKIVYDRFGKIAHREMYASDGTPYGTFKAEKEKNPALTADQYLDFLAENLNTWEKHHYFLKIMLDYKRWGKPITPIPSIEDILEQGYTNCLGFGFLEREVLLRRGFKANVVSLEKEHAACFIITFENGRYHSRFLCNWGYDENGNRYGHPVDPIKAQGYATPVEAYNSTVRKYHFKGLGLAPGEVYKVDDEVDIMKKVEVPEGQVDNRAYEAKQVAKLVSYKRKN